MTLFRTRPRRAAVALFASAGILLGVGGAVVPADAVPDNDNTCIAVSVWTTYGETGRDYKANKECVVPTGWRHSFMPGDEVRDTEDFEDGETNGAGAQVFIPAP